MARIDAGVPQGSILCTLLLIAYINDIFDITKNTTFITYAEDTGLFINGRYPDHVIDSANIVIIDLKGWVDYSCLE